MQENSKENNNFMKNFNLRNLIIEMLTFTIIGSVLINFLQFHDWIKSLKFGLVFGIIMAVFYTFILPKIKKK